MAPTKKDVRKREIELGCLHEGSDRPGIDSPTHPPSFLLLSLRAGVESQETSACAVPTRRRGLESETWRAFISRVHVAS